jgi:streptogramin lyase
VKSALFTGKAQPLNRARRFGRIFVVTALLMLGVAGFGAGVAGGASTGIITEYQIPTRHALSGGLAAGPDGNLWFTENDSNRIGKISP